MGLGRLRRYDVKASYACVLSLVSIVPLIAAVTVALLRYDHDLGQIIYGSKGFFLPAFGACVLLSVMPGAIGFVLGWSSAGQRRNDKPTRSWVGFFVGGAVLTFSLILLIAFLMLHLEQPM